MSKKNTEQPATFEEALNLLEDSVAKLETGELTLEESLEVFEGGIAASRACASLLDQTRKRVQVLVEKNGGLHADFLEEDDTLEEESDDADG